MPSVLYQKILVLAIVYGFFSFGSQFFNVAAIPIKAEFQHSGIVPRDDIGSSDAASDLYGLGVRLGFYLQGLGLLLHILRLRKASGANLKLPSGANAISLLAAWSILAGGKLLSPSEAYLVLAIVDSLMVPAMQALLDVDTIETEGVGLVLVMAAELWSSFAMTWTFARLTLTLPKLQTENVVFFFAKVSPTGWFRIFMLARCSLGWISTIWNIYSVYVPQLQASVKCYLSGTAISEDEKKKLDWLRWSSKKGVEMYLKIYDLEPKNHTESDLQTTYNQENLAVRKQLEFAVWMIGMYLDKNPGFSIRSFFYRGRRAFLQLMIWMTKVSKMPTDFKIYSRSYSWPRVVYPLFSWSFSVATVEKTILWNHLSPATDLRSPGQLIALVVGIAIFIDGVLFCCHPEEKKIETADHAEKQADWKKKGRDDTKDLISIVVLGERGVGKTNLIGQFVYSKFFSSYKETQDTDFVIKDISMGDYQATLQIWENGSGEEISTVLPLDKSDCCILVYDVNNSHSFDMVETYRTKVLSAMNSSSNLKDMYFIVVGNKVDNDNKVDIDESEQNVSLLKASIYFNSQNLPHVETSAKEGINVDQVFEEITRYIMAYGSKFAKHPRSEEEIRAADNEIINDDFPRQLTQYFNESDDNI